MITSCALFVFPSPRDILARQDFLVASSLYFLELSGQASAFGTGLGRALFCLEFLCVEGLDLVLQRAVFAGEAREFGLNAV